MLVGAKAWFLYPPGTLQAPDIPDPLTDFNAWLQQVLPSLPEARKPIGCLQRAGEALFMPPGWVHGTMNVGETVGVGVQGGYDYELRLATAKAALQVRRRISLLARPTSQTGCASGTEVAAVLRIRLDSLCCDSTHSFDHSISEPAPQLLVYAARIPAAAATAAAAAADLGCDGHTG